MPFHRLLPLENFRDGERANSSDGCGERVDDQRLPARVDKQQKGVRVDTEEDRSLQYLWLQASLASRSSPGRRRLSSLVLPPSINYSRCLNLPRCLGLIYNIDVRLIR